MVSCMRDQKLATTTRRRTVRMQYAQAQAHERRAEALERRAEALKHRAEARARERRAEAM